MFENINILNELKELKAEALIGAGKKNIYFLPDDFFDDLPGNITRQIWLNSVPNINPYYLPSDYFEHLPEIILDKLSLKVNRLNVYTESLYQVPHDYFNTLADNILEKVKAKNNNAHQELKELSPLLSKIPKTNIFTVPDGYFENLVPANYKQKKQSAKIISIGSKARRWTAYAVAACIAALALGGGYYYMQNKVINDDSETQNKVASAQAQQAISQLSDAQIADYLKDDNSEISVPQNDDQDIDIKMLLENTSDEEINNYLLENSDPDENTKGI